MGTIAEKLTYLNETKNAIKEAIVNKGVSVNDSDTFRSYADKISSIEAGGGTSGEDEFEAIFMSSIDDSLGANVTKLPNGITSIGHSAFYNCSNLALTELPNSITSIKRNSFSTCPGLKITKIPEGIKTIEDGAFQFCNGITSMEFHASLTEVKNSAFSSCNKLTSVIFKGNTNIGTYVFNGSKNLAAIIYLNATRVPTLSSNSLTNTLIANGTGYIYVPDDLVENFKTATYWKSYANQIRPVSELNLRSIEIVSNDTINTYNNNKTMSIKVTYNDGEIHNTEQEGYTLSVSGNATLDGNVLILNDNAQVGEIITITVTSTYDTSISSTKEIEVVYKEPSIAINLNEGQWVDSGTNVDGNIVYQSDAGSYNINNGISKAILTIDGYTNVKLYIRSFAEGNYDYTEAFAIDTTAVRGNGLYKTSGKQSATDYVECIYELDGGTHTIEIMYSKDGSGNNSDDRGYFYIGECS